jgi:hydrogenase-4 membrane subunit HyfE
MKKDEAYILAKIVNLACIILGLIMLVKTVQSWMNNSTEQSFLYFSLTFVFVALYLMMNDMKDHTRFFQKLKKQ